MNRTKENIVFVIALMLFVTLACNRFTSSSGNGNTANANNSDLAANANKQNKPPRDPNEKVFKGTIYGDRPSYVEMKLKREGNQITGTYFYTKVRKDIQVKGTVDGKNKFKMEETADGKVTGVFEGDWKDTESNPVIVLEGTWKKPGSNETLSFYAYEQPIEINGDGTIESKTINDDNKNKKIGINVEYPTLKGFGEKGEAINKDIFNAVNAEILSFKKSANEAVKDIPADSEIGCSLDAGYTTMIATDDVISFDCTVSIYLGGAHPNSYEKTLTYDLKTGRKVTLSELFKSKSDYLKRISDYSIEALKKQQRDPENQIEPDVEWITKGAAPEADNYGSWNIAKKGLVITFDPYQVAPYAAGPQVVVVPYKVLKDVVKEDGLLSPFIK